MNKKDKLKKYARELRNDSTLAEVLLWNKLKNKQMGARFLRQKVIGEYIVDFYCHKLKLIIEIDGLSHDEKIEYDENRQEYLENLGYSFLRFMDFEVKKEMDGVLRGIERFIEESEKSSDY